MKGEFKYLILKDRLDVEYPILWPLPSDQCDHRSGVSHREVAGLHSASGVRVVSAGFVTIGASINAGGRSESLRMDSRPIDGEVITRFFS